MTNTIHAKTLQINDIDKGFYMSSNILEDSWELLLMNHEQILLKLKYSYKNENFIALDGVIGQKIKQADLTVEEKLQRCHEVMQHHLMEYTIEEK